MSRTCPGTYTRLKNIFCNCASTAYFRRRRRVFRPVRETGDARSARTAGSSTLFATMSTGKGLSFRTRWRVHDPSLLSCAGRAVNSRVYAGRPILVALATRLRLPLFHGSPAKAERRGGGVQHCKAARKYVGRRRRAGSIHRVGTERGNLPIDRSSLLVVLVIAAVSRPTREVSTRVFRPVQRPASSFARSRRKDPLPFVLRSTWQRGVR